MDGYNEPTGYHVTYDDGDEEELGEIDGREDVRLLEDGLSPFKVAYDHGDDTVDCS